MRRTHLFAFAAVLVSVLETQPLLAQERAPAPGPAPSATDPAPSAPPDLRGQPSSEPSTVEEPRPPAVAPVGDVQSSPPTTTTTDTPAATPPAPAGDWPARLVMQAQGRDPAYFRRFEALREPGLSVTYPPIIDTVTGDTGGWRSKLADHHLLVELRDTSSLTGNLTSSGQPRDPQRFTGQRFTVSQQVIGTVTWGLHDLGIPNAKIVAGFNALYVSYRALGPTTFVIRDLYYYQHWADKTVELKFGIFPNYFEYVGFFTGGQPILSTGLSGLVPIAGGMSADPYPTPAANVTLNSTSTGAYAKFGVQRSVAPDGSVFEVTNTDLGLKFSQPYAGPIFVGELGLKRPPKAGEHQLWLRGGGQYNESEYTRYDAPGRASNSSFWGLADYQLAQVDASRAYRGVYIGGSGFYGDPHVNVFNQTYEARVYAIGPFDARPADAMAIRAGYTRYSPDAYRAVSVKGYANAEQYSLIASYTFHLFPGFYVVPNITYLKNPSFTGKFNDAAVLGTTFSVLL